MAVTGNRQCTERSAVKACVCVCVSWSLGKNKPRTSSTCSASSPSRRLFFHPPTPRLLPTVLFSSWLLLSYLLLPAGAEPPVLLYSHVNGGLTDAGFLAPGSNRPICAVDEVMSGWLSVNATKVAKWHLPSTAIGLGFKPVLWQIKTNASVQIASTAYKTNTFFFFFPADSNLYL